MTPISDSQTQLQTGLETFRGVLEETTVNGMDLFNYNLDITGHLNQFRSGEITNPKIIIISASNSQIPNRSVLFGVNHPEFPARLKLVLSQP